MVKNRHVLVDSLSKSGTKDGIGGKFLWP
ncbi:Protein of unknown function [Bacillus mycoides]|nr:Protein of unknown function [Bacillus mycoides]